MSNFCYFLPNVYAAQLAPGQRLVRSLLEERGLADLLADVDIPHAGLADLAHVGPGSKLCGCVLAPHTAAGDVPRLGYFPELQDWTPSIGGEQQYWLGRDRDQPTTPDSLRRRRPLVRGYDVTLGDGQVWHVPVVRRPTGTTRLPCHLKMTPAGLEEVVKAEYRALFDDFEPVATVFWEGGTIQRLVGCDVALRALAVNYRLGWDEQNALALLDGDNWLEVLKLAVDLPLFDDALQKKRALA